MREAERKHSNNSLCNLKGSPQFPWVQGDLHNQEKRFQPVKTAPSQRPKPPHGRVQQEMLPGQAVKFSTSGPQGYGFVVYIKAGKFYFGPTP